MQDDLSRIERVFGCVAEYNRCKEEDGCQYFEPSEEEIQEIEADQRTYNAKIRFLDGIPSRLAESLKEEWDAKKPAETGEWTMKEVYAWQEYGKAMLLDVVGKLCDLYGISYYDGMSIYKTEPESFAIGCEYQESPYIKEWAVSDLTYVEFKALFRDLYYLGRTPTMCYKDREGKSHILSNCSLGDLRINDLRRFGVESEEEIEKDLLAMGFDEESYKKEVLRELKEKAS